MSVSLKDEVRGAALGDQRLTKRLGRVIEELGAKPTMSVPAATRGRAEMEAAYRFFDNDKVSPEKILQPHIEATRERISQAEIVLLVQDTTDIDLTRPNQQVKGAGPMEYDTRRGVFFHPLLAFNSHGLPLGVAWQKSWARNKIKKNAPRKREMTGIERRPSRERKVSAGSKACVRRATSPKRARGRLASALRTVTLTFMNCSANHARPRGEKCTFWSVLVRIATPVPLTRTYWTRRVALHVYFNAA